ncbi:MAG: hypothetical protein CL573_04020 [Alphaproteobacteria bacterium]|nr:hypothetical protein [Alphaproteobacteria bacterium]HCP00164.1 hypothetical protein [Rhodospirillaceae bacterium]
MNDKIHSTRALWFVLFLMTLVQVLATFAALTLAAIAPAVAVDIEIQVEFIGFQVALIYAGASAISALSDFLLRRWGPTRISQISLGLCGGGIALSAVPSIPVMAVGALILGCGYGMTNPSATQILMQLTPNRVRNLVFSVKQTGVPIGGMAAGLVAPGAAEAFGWQAAPLIVAASCVILIFTLQRWRNLWDTNRDPTARLDASAFAALAMVWQVPTLRWLSIGGFTYAFTQLSISTFAVTILVIEAQFSLVAAGAVLAATQAAGIIGRVIWGLIADRWSIGDRLLIIIGMMNLAGAFAMIWVGPEWPVWTIYLLFVAFAASALGWTGIFISSTVGHAPREQSGAVAGGIGVPVYAGVIFGAAVLSALAETMGSVSNTYAVVMAVVAFGLVAFTIASRSVR